ncbi:MAG TPA: SAM-dependent methyltransferase [Chitinophagaceae bacterium]|nr:SAM-dependent methyltransferase [Chitinophagaceae bacterium]
MPGTLYMIPVPLATEGMHTLSPEVGERCKTLKYFFVENIREARRFLKTIDRDIDIDTLSFSETNRNTELDTTQLKSWLQQGFDVGVLSDAGCPGIADPGAELAAAAHTIGADICPLTGPSSVLLALMASGLNGQSFAFNGYLPVKEPERSKKIKSLELLSSKENQTQIFIETPYRNNAIFQDLLRHCQGKTRLCLAVNITAPNQYIRTKTIAVWAKENISLPKEPAIFLFLA